MFFAASNGGLLVRRNDVISQLGIVNIIGANSASPANPAASEGDLLLRFAARTNGSEAITVPSGWTVPTGGLYEVGVNTYAVLAYQYVGAGGSSVTGNWVNAQSIITYAIRGAAASNPVRDCAAASVGSSEGVVFSALDLESSTSDWVFAFARTQNDISSSDTAPTGLFLRHSDTRRLGADSNGPISSWAGTTETLTGHGIAVTYTAAIRSA